MSTRVGVVGFLGYGGAELVAILERHPAVEGLLLADLADSAGSPRPRGYQGHPRVPSMPEAVRQGGADVVFLATPHEVSMVLAPQLLDAGAKVIDLSGAFRLRTPDTYIRWYGDPHTEAALLAEAAYGLPEFNREAVRPARLIANPGCYPTAANLAIRPLVEAGLVDRSSGIVCDAKSGVSGAGRKPSLKTSYCEVEREFRRLLHPGPPPRSGGSADLRPGGGRIQLHGASAPHGTRDPGDHLLPSQTRPRCRLPDARLRTALPGEPFIRLYEPGQVPDLHSVRHTNYCDIGVKVDAASGRAVVVSVIDNLVKGAAGQAVQNMNLMLGYPETTGLL